jgi:hypothetical protein
MPDGGLGQLRPELPIHFFPKQLLAFFSKATELLFGGSAGPGKSHFVRIAAIVWCAQIAGLQVYLFRRVEDDLLKNHMEGPKGFRNLLADWVKCGFVKIIETEIQFLFNGSKIFLCHCKDDKHRYKYHGSEIHVLIIDELTTFTEIIYRYLRFRLRMVGIKLPDIYKKGCVGMDGTVNAHNLFPRVVCASNPGNIGHHWVKRTFGLDRGVMLEPTQMEDDEGGLIRQYIGALLKDNPAMEEDDPTYRARMRGLGDPALVKAMEDGDWNIIAGGFFPEFRLDRHVIKTQQLPKDKFTKRFRAVDWGSARPFSVGWYAIADEEWDTVSVLGNPITVPRGSIVRYREWYGKKKNQDNIGLKMPVEVWTTGVYKRTGDESIAYDVVDTQMFQSDGGPSLSERSDKVKAPNNDVRIKWRGADKRRIGEMGAGIGWDQVRARLRGPDADEEGNNGTPMFYLMDNQPDAIRILQAVQHDDVKIEDINTEQEDHAADEIRYACMSRPLPNMKQTKRRLQGPKAGTFDHMMLLTGTDEEKRLHRGGSKYNIDEG